MAHFTVEEDEVKISFEVRKIVRVIDNTLDATDGRLVGQYVQMLKQQRVMGVMSGGQWFVGLQNKWLKIVAQLLGETSHKSCKKGSEMWNKHVAKMANVANG